MTGQTEGLRQRKVKPADASPAQTPPTAAAEDVYGLTPEGKRFKIPATHDFLSSLFDPRLRKSQLDMVIIASFAAQFIAFAILPTRISRIAFLVAFGSWRLAYNAGLGWLLHKQSTEKWMIRIVKREGWLDSTRRPKLSAWLRKQISAKLADGEAVDQLPLEFQTWMLFRHLADIILLNDFLAYSLFATAWLQFPPHHSVWLHIIRWVAGWSLIFFNVWVKVDAHRVVSDYAWFWGDVFFQRLSELTFDGVFSLAPHPMYSVGYAGFSGLSLVVASHTVLFVSMLAHACQFAFLVFFENPHIERTYGHKEPIVQRRTVAPPEPSVPKASPPISPPSQSSSSSSSSFVMLSDSDPDSDAGDATETDEASPKRATPMQRMASARKPEMSIHDLNTRYLYKDVIIFHNLDLLRARDLVFVVALVYATLAIAFPVTSSSWQLHFAFANALAWRLFYSFGLGGILRAQSQTKWMTRHFLKHYTYETDDGAVRAAFHSFKFAYNFSSVMVYTSFAAFAWRAHRIHDDWYWGNEVLRYVFGALLIGLHVWTALSTFEVLGEFGWFYGDFFVEEYPRQLLYTGVYRFLNNPERIMGGAAFFGMALISGSKRVTALAVISMGAHMLFLSFVENPHMRKLYGDALRSEAGVTRTLKSVAERNVPPELRKVVREVQGTFDKVTEEAAEAVTDFIKKTDRRLSEYARDTKVLLQQSRERMIITRISTKLAGLDVSQYSLTLVNDTRRVHFGAAITLAWKAPASHSRKDWIGIYRVGANPKSEVTQVSSQKKWLGLYDEWDGDEHKGTAGEKASSTHAHEGVSIFKSHRLPAKMGVYEFRLHHDGGHNVLAMAGPIEIYVDRPSDVTSFDSIRQTLLKLIILCLDSDPNLVPNSSQSTSAPSNEREDDFSIFDADQAGRIAYAIHESCDVELAREVVIADANVTKLAKRVLAARRILKPW